MENAIGNYGLNCEIIKYSEWMIKPGSVYVTISFLCEVVKAVRCN